MPSFHKDPLAASEPVIPHDVLVSLFASVLAEHRRIIAEQQGKIEVLERALKVAASSWRPANAVIH